MISIIIPTYREGSVIEETLKKLQAGIGSSSNYEIIVSDGKSPDGTIEISKKYADKVIVDPEPEKRSIARGKNLGAWAAKGEYLVFIDADVTIPDQHRFFMEALKRFETDKRLMGLTVRVEVSPKEATFADRFFFAILNLVYILFNNVLRVGNASGEFQMIRANAFKKAGGYNESLAAGEDNEMFAKLSRMGKTHIETSLRIYHSGRRAHKVGWSKLLYAWLKNGVYVLLFNRSAYKKWEDIR